ncbi:MAG TPA: methyltransferase domain-containing protein [Kofleriaceae bacterium]|nr:methyltransferase domain-containing protein [Kofleriaceae bacterium]
MNEQRMEFYSREREVSGWETWHDWHEMVMRPVADWLVRASGAAAGQKILDVACGTGIPGLLLAEAVGATGKVVGIDISPKMLTGMRNKAAARGLRNIETREVDALTFGGPDAVFDAVTCKDGFMFFPDIVAGVRELRRVVKPGGRYAFSAWAEPQANPAFATLFGPLAEALKLPPPAPDTPGPFRLAAPGALERVVRDAGFTDVTVERVAITWTFASVAQHWEIFSVMAGPLERAIATLPESELAQLKQKLAESIAPFATADGGLRFPGVEWCVSGTR